MNEGGFAVLHLSKDYHACKVYSSVGKKLEHQQKSCT